MKNVFLFLSSVVVLLCSNHAYAQDNRQESISLKIYQMSLKEVLKEVEKQTYRSFVYTEDIDLSEIKDLNFSTLTLPQALHIIFANTKVDWRFYDRHIILKEKTLISRKEPQTIVISGFITRSSTDKPLSNASVKDLLQNSVAQADNDGYYSIEVNKGEVYLLFSHIGHHPQRVRANLEDNTTINISLKEETLDLPEIEIIVIAPGSDDGIVDLSGVSVGRRKMASFNEFDPLTSLHYMSGFQSGVEGVPGINVQGANHDQNIMLIDGVETYNTGHAIDVFSLYNGNITKKMSLQKEFLPAYYGNNLSSVMDMQVKDGSLGKHNGKIKLGTAGSSFNMNGPILKGKTAYLFSVRRSTMELYEKLLEDRKNELPRFTLSDINAKITHRLSEKSSIDIAFHSNEDKLDARQTRNIAEGKTQSVRDIKHWRNMLAMSKWNYHINKDFSGYSLLAYREHKSNHTFSDNLIDGQIDTYNSSIYNKSQIQDIQFGTHVTWFPDYFNTINAGGEIIHHRFNPEYKTNNLHHEVRNQRSIESSVYALDQMDLSDILTANIGVRGSMLKTARRTYYNIQPRASLSIVLTDELSLKPAYSRSNQYKFILSSASLDEPPSDMWLSVNEYFKPISSDQYTLGINYNLNTDYNFILNGFYHQQKNLPYAHSPSVYFTDQTSGEIEFGDGENYGGSLFIQKNSGNLSGWIGYSLAWSNLQYKNINNGNPFAANYDRRHNVGVNINYNLNKKVDISAAWSYVTGSQLSKLERNNTSESVSYNHMPTYKLPPSHHLDIFCNYTVSNNISWMLSVQNVYNRRNPYFAYSSMSLGDSQTYNFSLYGIIPNLSFIYRIR